MSQKDVGTVVLLTGLGSLGGVGKGGCLETRILSPVSVCPLLPSLGPGVPVCKMGSPDELVCGSLPAPMCRDFGPGDRCLAPVDFRRRCCDPGPSLPHQAPCQAL